jgi:hypothetical protein
VNVEHTSSDAGVFGETLVSRRGTDSRTTKGTAMTVVTSKSTAVVDPKKLDGVLERMRDVQTEGDRWELAEALEVLVPKGNREFGIIIDAATKELDVLRDLTDHNGAGLISAIGNEQNSDKLDRLNASLTKVIGHVEKLRAKAARKTTPVKTTTPAAVKPKVAPANGARPKKKAGDLRGL